MTRLDVENLGQVFTPPHIVSDMLALVQNNGRFLEPSCGDGAFYKNLPQNTIGIELDTRVLQESGLILHTAMDSKKQIFNMDFFTYPVSEKFHTIIGNPPLCALSRHFRFYKSIAKALS